MNNTAAWQMTQGAALELSAAPYTAPGRGEIVVRNAALAINPADWLLQDMGATFGLEYPMILGNDVAGEVVEVGEGETRFRVGDRVVGQAIGCWISEPAKGGFQQYTVLETNLVAKLPASLSYERAVVIPLGLSTAACGLFQEDQLGLQLPSVEVRPTGKTLLIWGGASSVGSNAIQLAVASGYGVVTTASPKNFAALKELGADEVFDYRSDSVVDDLVAYLNDKDVVGALFTTGSTDDCYAVVDRCEGRKFVSSTLPVPEHKPAGVAANQIFATTLRDNGVGLAVYRDYLEPALVSGTFAPAPAPLVVGEGFSALTDALARQQAGVSAAKVVVRVGSAPGGV